MNKKVEAAINAQINAEMWSAYLYLSMASYCHNEGLSGMANWFTIQFNEEQAHAMIMFNYVISRGGRVELKPLEEVQVDWDSPLAAFESTLAHEKIVTGLINDIYALAIEEKDYATQNAFQWFIDEQVEEEESAQEIIDKLRLIKDNGYGIYMIDKELSARVYTAPALLAK